MMTPFGEEAKLLPVSQWRWHLYAVRYLDSHGNTVGVERMVTTSTHIANDVWSDFTPRAAESVEWYCIQEDVRAPRTVGQIYGMDIMQHPAEAAYEMPR